MTRTNALELLKKVGLSFRRNWGLKLVSLFFAVILWNYVIAEVNPVRPMTFSGVPMEIQGIPELEAADYTIEGDVSDYLKDITVVADLPRNAASSVKSDDFKAVVSVANITGEGTFNLRVEIDNPPRGVTAIKSISPATISVTVKELEDKIVPVSYAFEGTIPEGYWHGEPALTPSKSLTVKGAKTLVDKVDHANITISLDNLRESVASARSFELVDAEGNPLDDAGLKLDPPNCMVSMEVLPKKTVPVVADKTLTGAVAEGYEITGVTVDPQTVEIAGPQERLNAITEIRTNLIDIEGAKSPLTVARTLDVPEGVRVVNVSMVNVQIAVEQKMTTKILDSLPIAVKNLAAGLILDQAFTSSVTVTCPELLAAGIKPANVSLWVDASGIGAGNHTLKVLYDFDERSGITGVVPAMGEIDVVITEE